MYSRSFVHPADQKPEHEALPEKPRRPSRSVKPRPRRAPADPPAPPPPEPRSADRGKKRRPPPEPAPPPPPAEEPRGKRRFRRRPVPAAPVPAPEPPPAPERRENGLMGLLKSVSTQDLLLIGLIFLLTMEQADDDIIFILIALLFISSGE